MTGMVRGSLVGRWVLLAKSSWAVAVRWVLSRMVVWVRVGVVSDLKVVVVALVMGRMFEEASWVVSVGG